MIVLKLKDKIIVPIDTCNIDTALKTVNTIGSRVGMFKFGLELLSSIIVQLVTTNDISLLKKVQCLFEMVEGQLFWDGKWDDIPNTVAGAATAVSLIRPTMVNVHASAGTEAIKAAIDNSQGSIVLGVTVLTSISSEECISIFGDDSTNKVIEFAKTLVNTQAQGIVCSPKELRILTSRGFDQLLKVTPGIRPAWACVGDQKRVMTPGEAIKAGADYLVIGRPITNPPAEIGSPIEAIARIIQEMEAAKNE